MSLQCRHNGLDGVSNHQPHHCLFSRLIGRRSKKTSKLHVTGLCAGNSPVASEFPAQMASNAENVSICWRHHVGLDYVSNCCEKIKRVIIVISVDSMAVLTSPQEYCCVPTAPDVLYYQVTWDLTHTIGVSGTVRFLVVGTIGQGERPPRGQLWMEQCLTLLKYWPI